MIEWRRQKFLRLKPVVDVTFAAGDKLPEINNNAQSIKMTNKNQKSFLKSANGNGVVRTIAMEMSENDSWDGSVDTGRPISVPVGKKLLDVSSTSWGDTIDLEEAFQKCPSWIHS